MQNVGRLACISRRQRDYRQLRAWGQSPRAGRPSGQPAGRPALRFCAGREECGLIDLFGLRLDFLGAQHGAGRRVPCGIERATWAGPSSLLDPFRREKTRRKPSPWVPGMRGEMSVVLRNSALHARVLPGERPCGRLNLGGIHQMCLSSHLTVIRALDSHKDHTAKRLGRG